jgi:hypothetical protein
MTQPRETSYHRQNSKDHVCRILDFCARDDLESQHPRIESGGDGARTTLVFRDKSTLSDEQESKIGKKFNLCLRCSLIVRDAMTIGYIFEN